MSLDKSNIPKRGNSSRKIIPKKQRKIITDHFVDRITRARTDKVETFLGRMVESRSQKSSKEQKAMLEMEVYTDQAMNENQEVHGPEGKDRRVASESTPVEQGHDFATSTGTLDREEMSEMSGISTEIVATRRSPTDNTMMAGGTEKQTTSSSFSATTSARLLSEAEVRRKDKPQELATQKMQAVTKETCEAETVTAADDFKSDYRAATRDALNRVQQELVTKEIEQYVKLELENEKLQEQLNTFEATEVEETKAPSSLSKKLNVISGQRFGMVPQGSKIQSIISVTGHQVIRNLSELSEFLLMHLDTYADYLRQVDLA